MAFVITRLCRDCVDGACIDVCPVDCIVKHAPADRESELREETRRLKALINQRKDVETRNRRLRERLKKLAVRIDKAIIAAEKKAVKVEEPVTP